VSFSFIEPMKALPAKKLPEGDWLYEVKLDGYRALASKDGKDVQLISRNNKPLNYPQLLDALKLLPADHVILDGEIVALDEKGRSSFQLLQVYKSSERRVPLVYYVFDLLFLDGKDLRKEPLAARRKLLAAVLRISGSPKGCRALKRTCFGSPRSSGSKAWLPSDLINSLYESGRPGARQRQRQNVGPASSRTRTVRRDPRIVRPRPEQESDRTAAQHRPGVGFPCIKPERRLSNDPSP
jgi:hypothetical protein